MKEIFRDVNAGTFYADNESLKLPQSEQKGVLTKSLASRLKGKEGRLRMNIMGKRVDYSARTVISVDPNLNIDEFGVPQKIAMNLTKPVYVNDRNIKFLTKLVKILNFINHQYQ